MLLQKTGDHYILIVMFLLLTTSCENITSDAIIEMPGSFIEAEFSLDQIASDLTFIPLKNDVPVNRSSDIIWYNSHFYYCDRSIGKIYRFNEEGGLIDILDKAGRGNGEYQIIVDFFIDNRTGNIYISTNNTKIVVYDNDFNYLRDIKYPVDRDGTMRVRWIENQIHIIYFNYTTTGFSWIKIDTLGNLLDSKKAVDIWQASMVSYPLQVFSNGNKIYRYYFSSDTIYEIDSSGHRPYRLVRKDFNDGFNLDHHSDYDSPKKNRVVRSIFGIGDYWIINYQKVQHSVKFRVEETVLYDYRSNLSYLIASDEVFQRSVSIGPIIDWVGSGTFFPMNTITIDNDNYLIYVVDALRFLEIVDCNEFREGIPKRPEIKQKMQEIADTLTVNDNPIIMLLKLK